MAYIKTHSNYVIKKRHQDTNDGTIYERDITTIGGLNSFSKGQIPIYQSGNFIITINNEPSYVKDYSSAKWAKNKDNGEVWTLSSISGLTDATNDTVEVTRQDYYKLRDFAYFGSCSELIRASLTDIIDRFPGELFAPKINGSGITMFYTDRDNHEQDQVILGDETYKYLLDNPFEIDIHTTRVSNEELANPLKYFCNNGWKNYEVVDENGEKYEITSWSSTPQDYCTENDDGTKEYKLIRSIINISYEGGGINIGAFMGDSNRIVYLVGDNGLNLHIRPKEAFYDTFIKSLDSFQAAILNVDSTPKYSVLLEVIKENSYGYYTEMRRFTFPTTFGGYNLSVNDPAYATYLNDLVEIATFYDEIFSDNLYRAMTHEAIKNFDWSYSREYTSGDEDEYVFGGTRIQNALRLIAREFDEIKYYIDGIGRAFTLSYNNNDNMPKYYLSDTLTNDGWDVTNVTPFIKKTEENSGTTRANPNEHIEFVQADWINIYPFSSKNDGCFPNGYFINFKSDNCGDGTDFAPAESGKTYTVTGKGVLRTKIRQFFTDEEYTMQEVNDLFMKLLRLNSRQIYRHKGTLEGIEMILALFGLKSKRWYDKKILSYYDNTDAKNMIRVFSPYADKCDASSDETYDYEIKEYSVLVKPIEDIPSINKDGEYEIDWYNQTKTLTYDTDDFRNGIYIEYQGLPVKCYEVENEEDNTEKRYLVPFFDKDKIIDGDPYFQMKGGWLYKTHQFNQKDVFIEDCYTETLKNVPSVNNLRELFSLPYNQLQNGTIYQVRDINTRNIIIDGVVYDLETEYSGSTSYDYFTVTIKNNSVKIGQQLFIDSIAVSSPFGKPNMFTSGITEETYYFDNYSNGYEIRVYLIGENKDVCTARETFLADVIYIKGTLFKDKEVYPPTELEEGKEKTDKNYFQIVDRKYKSTLSKEDEGNGWVQLESDSLELQKIWNIENYFKGNNPHLGNLQYDSGEEYLDYFRHLFKHAIENKEFDLKCYYGDTMNDVLTKVDKGFEIKEENMLEDDKVLFDGNVYVMNEKDACDASEGDKTYRQYIYNKVSVGAVEGSDNQEYYNLSSKIEDLGSICKYKDLEGDYFLDGMGFSEQIINSKRIDIKFNMDSSNDCLIKYMDDVVMKYLSQMIPSNTIVHVSYETV